MSDEDHQRLEERKLRAKQVLEQTQIQHTCDVIPIGMIKNYKLRCDESIEDLPFYPSEIGDYIRILERIIEPVMKGRADNVNLAAYVQGVVNEIVIDLPPIMTEPIVQISDPVAAAQYNSHLSPIAVGNIDDFSDHNTNDIKTTVDNLLKRVSQLESEVRKLKNNNLDTIDTSGRVNPLGSFLEQIATSSFLDD
jgi:hypothetical protein